jgi:MFS family permease
MAGRRLMVLVMLLVTADLTLWSAVVPLLPHYRGALHLSTAQAGLVLAAFSAAVVVVAVPAGHLADRLGPKRVTAAGVAAMLLATVLLGVAQNLGELLLARTIQGAADAAVWTAGVAWVAAETPVDRRGRVVAVVEGGATVGIVLGPLVGGVGSSVLGIRGAFLLAAGLLAALLGWTLIEPAATRPPEPPPGLRRAIAVSSRDPVIGAAVGMILLVSVVGATLQLLVPLHLAARGISRSGIGIVYTIAALVGTAATVASGRLGDRVGRLALASAASLLLAVAAAGLALSEGRVAVIAITIAGSGVMAVLYAVGYPLGADGADRAGLGHGVVLGVINLVWGVGAVVGPVAGSALSQAAGDRVSYALLAALCACSAAGLEAARRLALPAAATGMIDVVEQNQLAGPDPPA